MRFLAGTLTCKRRKALFWQTVQLIVTNHCFSIISYLISINWCLNALSSSEIFDNIVATLKRKKCTLQYVLNTSTHLRQHLVDENPQLSQTLPEGHAAAPMCILISLGAHQPHFCESVSMYCHSCVTGLSKFVPKISDKDKRSKNN